MPFNDSERHERLTLKEWGVRLTQGWDRVGTNFFRIRYQYYLNPDLVSYERMPLRYKLNGFEFTKSQQAVLRKNADLTYLVRPCIIDEAKYHLFQDWYKQRFGSSESIYKWVDDRTRPFRSQEIAVYDKDKLIACSFFDNTPKAQYSTIACFDPNEHKRSLGIFTLLLEIENAAKKQKIAHYPGHAFVENSMYDYKKKFNNIEYFDWETQKWLKNNS
ncbi:MAG: hypothetical protein RI894_562 [Bacteroidota bacterium]|jgi:arginine-tRNA-protein transferase